MPDWDIELTRTLGEHQGLTHKVLIENIDKYELAKVGGIEACLQAALQPDSFIPREALDAWNNFRRNGGYLQEVQTDLEQRFNITFTCMQHVEAPAVAAQPTPRSDARTTPPAPNGRGVNPVGLLEQLKQRYAEIVVERKRLDEEYEILSRLFGKPKRKYERKAKATARTRRSMGQRERNKSKGVRAFPKKQHHSENSGESAEKIRSEA